MTEIERKALALVNEVQAERNHTGSPWNSPTILSEALDRAIERHEAYKQEVSDALLVYQKADGLAERSLTWDALTRFIIAKPDPLVEAVRDTGLFTGYADQLRAAIEKRGGNIVWGEG